MAVPFHFKKAAIIGVGLIGGSLAMSMRARGLVTEVVGIGRGLPNLEAARRLGVVDSFTRDVAEGVAGADLVVVAVPVLKIAETVRQAAPAMKPGCIVTDVGSVKASVIASVEPLMPEGARFVPGHPIAGTEHSGVEAAFPELFIDRWCILTPTPRTDKAALDSIRALWEAAGSKVAVMDPEVHDIILAAVSHLPHMIAYTLVNAVAGVKASGQDVLSYSAGGFRDFTRIASSSPEMWADICSMNRGPILSTIDDFQARLETLKRLIDSGDMEGIRREFESAKDIRDSLVKAKEKRRS